LLIPPEKKLSARNKKEETKKPFPGSNQLLKWLFLILKFLFVFLIKEKH